MRALVPYLLIAAVITVLGAVAYGSGAVAWVVYAATGAATLIALAGCVRLDERRHSQL